MESALIADIKRMTLHDGPGIRSTVFVKGCPLRCLWCHNPESISAKPQVLYHENLCLHCGNCDALCPEQAIHCGIIDRSKCTGCGSCTAQCFREALTLSGKTMTTEEVFRSDPEREAIIEEVSRQMQEEAVASVIPVENKRVMTQLQKLKIKTDNGISISLPRMLADDENSFAVVNNDDGTMSIIISRVQELKTE